MPIEKLYLGTQGWSYSSWVGSFYPPRTQPADYLPHYATQFNTVELDTTFYAIPRQSTIANWRERTPEHFRFAAKFPKIITHEKQLVDCREETIIFLETMTELGQKLGPLLLQMPPAFSADNLESLSAFVRFLPTGFRYALEIRHRSWLKADIQNQLLELLRSQGMALCLVEHLWMPRLDELTGDYVYVRWLGRREDVPDDDFSAVRIDRDKHLDSWAEQLAQYLSKGVTVYGYFNNHYQGHSPASVRALQMRLEGILEGGEG